MRKALVSLHNRRVSFSDPVQHETAPPSVVAGLRFRATFTGGRSAPVDLTRYPLPAVAAAAATILWQETQPGGTFRSPGPVSGTLRSLARFADFLKAYDRSSEINSLHDLIPEDINTFETYLRQRYGIDSITTWNMLQPMRRFLELALSYGYASDKIIPRLAYVSLGGKGKRAPKDGYSPFVANQLREAARKDIEAIIERITVTGPAFVAEGRDPEEHGWKNISNIAWYLKHRGHLSFRDIFVRSCVSKLTVKYSSVVSYLHLTADDVVPFIVALSLSTGLPIESIRCLKKDCLRNEKNGYASLHYMKRRRGGRETETSMRVRSDAPLSPGWLVKALIRLSQITRTHIAPEQQDWLFIGYSRREYLTYVGRISTADNRETAVSRFTKRHHIVDDAGKPLLSFEQDRLRKTFKAEQYVRVNGHLADAATDHSKGVHARHYADIPSLRSLHEATAEAGLVSAMEAAFTPIILDPAGEARLQRDPEGLAAQLKRPVEQVESVASGSTDVWLAGCLDFENSPHGISGSDCPCPVWGCLECKNAVITSAKLPAILAFLNHLLSKRQQINLDTWSNRFGRAHRRIIEQILPRFPTREVIMAKAVAEADEHLVWLPAELTQAP